MDVWCQTAVVACQILFTSPLAHVAWQQAKCLLSTWGGDGELLRSSKKMCWESITMIVVVIAQALWLSYIHCNKVADQLVQSILSIYNHAPPQLSSFPPTAFLIGFLPTNAYKALHWHGSIVINSYVYRKDLVSWVTYTYICNIKNMQLQSKNISI